MKFADGTTTAGTGDNQEDKSLLQNCLDCSAIWGHFNVASCKNLPVLTKSEGHIYGMGDCTV